MNVSIYCIVILRTIPNSLIPVSVLTNILTGIFEFYRLGFNCVYLNHFLYTRYKVKSDTNRAGNIKLKIQSLFYSSTRIYFNCIKRYFFMHFLYNLLQVLFPVTIRLYSRKHIIDRKTNRGCVSLLTIRNHDIVFL